MEDIDEGLCQKDIDEGSIFGNDPPTPTNPSLNEHEQQSGGEAIKSILKPFVGMEFDTLKASEDFWTNYGYEIGFGGRVQNTNTSKDKVVTSRTYLCSKAGKKCEDMRRINAKPRADTRCNCEVLMRISLKRETSKYYVTQFVENHNHGLEGKETIHILRAHQSISESQAHDIDMAARAGLRPKQTHRHMAIQAGGSENLSFTRKRLNSHLQHSRGTNLGIGEASAILDYFQEKSSQNPSFFHTYQLDTDSKITNVFWADPSMLVDYELFGDVVSFDTTFGTNKLSRPLGVFSGLNNHRQIVVFGGCLLYDETADSFVWLFGVFLDCHRGKLPGIIFTDQDAAMKIALSEMMPTVRHALCTWHIGQNALENLQRPDGIDGDISLFMLEFYQCVNDILDVDEFVLSWWKMAKKYGLTENPWLQKIYKLKNQFCIAFMKDIFAAGARTTQMSESLNHNLKLDLGSGLTMRSFFHGFDLFLTDVRAKELISDCYSRQTFPHLINRFSSILKQVSAIYTPKIFKLFSEQFELMILVRLDKNEVVNYPHVIMAMVGDSSYKINFDPSSMIISCSCCRFEIWGLLCAHILKVFHVWNINEIPEKYILNRWTRVAKSKHHNMIHHSSGLGKPKKLDVMDSEYRGIRHRVVGSDSEKMFEGVCKRLNDIHLFINECTLPNRKEDEVDSPAPFDPVDVRNGVVVTGVRRKVIQKRGGKRRTVKHTEGKRGAKKLRAKQQKELKSKTSSQVNEAQLDHGEDLT